MNTEYAIGNLRIHFESRARRRWFVALCYSVIAILCLAEYFLNPKLNPSISRMTATGAWTICICGILYVALIIVFTWLASDARARGDEREMQRRERAFSRAYPVLGCCIGASFLAACFGGPSPLTPLSPLALREFLVPLPFVLLMATVFLYMTLPPAILLWTEPDMDTEVPR